MGKKKDISVEDKNAIIHFLLQNLKNGKPLRGMLSKAMDRYSVSSRTVSRLWNETKKKLSSGEALTIGKRMHKAREKKQVFF